MDTQEAAFAKAEQCLKAREYDRQAIPTDPVDPTFAPSRDLMAKPQFAQMVFLARVIDVLYEAAPAYTKVRIQNLLRS